MKYRVIENSPVALIAKLYRRSSAIAITFGTWIHINGVKKEEFLQNKVWVEHEIQHIRQYQQYGFLRFLILYLIESVKYGYCNNRFEVEAREVAARYKRN